MMIGWIGRELFRNQGELYGQNFNSPPTAIDHLISEDPVEHKLTTGLCITYQDGITLFFNKAYAGSPGVDDPDAADMHSYQIGPSYSQTFIPDIVVEKAGKKLIFDAKYKGRKGSGGFYGGDDQGSVWTWKPEDINKMHTYREAIKGKFRYNNLTNQIIILYV